MPNPRIQVIIDALNMAEDDLKKLDREIEGLDKTSRKSSRGFGNLQAAALTATAAIAGIGFAGKKAFEFAEQGAQLQLTQERFERLSGTIGTTSDALRDDLQIATRGMLSEMESMQLATDLMSLGLAKSHEEAVRLTNVASQLNMDMNQLVLTLTNQTTMRFDALGVAVDGFDEKVQKLEESGHDANEAFKLAFMQQAEEQIEKVGSAADSAAGQFKKAQANWQDLMDNMNQGTLKAVLPAVEAMNAEFDLHEELDMAVKRRIITEEERINLINRMRRSTFDAADAMLFLEQRTEEYNNRMSEAERVTSGADRALMGLVERSKEAEVTLGGPGIENAIETAKSLQEAYGEVRDEINDAIEAAKPWLQPEAIRQDVFREMFAGNAPSFSQVQGPGQQTVTGTATHVVQAGQTLSEIAAESGTTIERLVELNDQIQNPNLIFAGEELKVPFEETRDVISGEGDSIKSGLNDLTSRQHRIDIMLNFQTSGANVSSDVVDRVSEKMMERFSFID